MTESMLKNRVYIVTGGSQGFGFAIAKELIKAGGRVGLVARSTNLLNSAVAQLEADLGAGKATAATADIRDSSQIQSAFESIQSHFGRVDGLVNNAGVARPGTIADIPEEDLRLQFEINVIGLAMCCQAAIPMLAGSENARIVNIGSASASYREECRHLGIYAASKHAVDRLTAELRDELRAENIGVSLVVPGNSPTDFAKGWDEERLMKGYKAWSDYGKYMETGMEQSDVGEAVVHCVSRRPGVAVDSLTVRPHLPTEKFTW